MNPETFQKIIESLPVGCAIAVCWTPFAVMIGYSGVLAVQGKTDLKFWPIQPEMKTWGVGFALVGIAMGIGAGVAISAVR